MDKNERMRLMGEGSVTVALLRFGMPMVVSMLVTSVPTPFDDYTIEQKKNYAIYRSSFLGFYQLAFLTPGISPFEAISRNCILDIPN